MTEQPPETPERLSVDVHARKTVTFIFADIIDSTPLGERLDPEALRAVIDRWSSEMRAAIEHHGGVVEKFIGDAVAAVFGIPRVREDDALRAVRAAVEMRYALAALNDDLAPLRVEMRTGVNTGEVIAGAPETGWFYATGDAVNVAARLEQSARAGEILVGPTTYALVRDAVVVEPVGELKLKGKTDGVEAWRLLSIVPGAPGFRRRFDIPLVGRGTELDVLLSSFAAASEGAVAVTVVGEAGVGNTRLVNELVTQVDERARVLVGRCAAYGDGATFLPLAEILGQLDLATLLDGDPDADVVRRSIAGVLYRDAAGLTTHETFWGVRRLLELAARTQPVLAIVEDVHWATPTLLDFLDYVAAFTLGPVLIAVTARPELLERRAAWEPIVRLGPLADGDAFTLLDELAKLPTDARERVVDVAGGNPLFIEQLAAAFARGEVEAVPATLESVLAARVEQLDDHERAMLGRAAVIGREFWRGAVAHLASGPDAERTTDSLMALIRKEFILPDRSRFPREDGFRFRHVLIQQVAYNAVAKRTRADLHERHAAWLTHAGAEDELVGFHLEQAVLCRRALGLDADRLAERAAGILSEAGERARKRSDVAGAAALARRAAALAPERTLIRPQVLIRLTRALWWHEPREVSPIAEEASRLAVLAGLDADAAEADVWRAKADLIGLGPSAVERLDAAVAAARPALETTGDDSRVAFVREAQAWVEHVRSRPGDAAETLRAALAAAGRAGDWFLFATIVAGLGFAFLDGPTPTDEMLRRGHVLLAEHPDLIGLRIAVLGETTHVANLLRGAYDDAWAEIREATGLAERIGLRHGAAFGWAHMARIALDQGDFDAALAHARHGQGIADGLGLPLAHWRLYASDALIGLRQGDAAAAELDAAAAELDAVVASDASHTRWAAPEIPRLQGRLALLRGDAEEGVMLIERSLAPSRGTQCIWPQIYHGYDLACALAAAGRAEDAAAAAKATQALAEAKGALVYAARARDLAQSAAHV